MSAPHKNQHVPANRSQPTGLPCWIRRHRRAALSAFVALCHLLGALTSIRAIMDVRTSQGAVAWVVSLNTFPYVAVPAYWIFGRDKFNGYVVSRREDDVAVQKVRDEFEKLLIERDLVAFPGREEKLLVERLADLPFTRGNDIDLLIDGDETFDSMFSGIARAENYVLVQFYIIRDDSVGRALKDALLERARNGVRCLLAYDEIGTDLPASYVEELRSAGVDVRPFNTTQGDANRFQINFRNHRKIVIIDGREAWVGGLNVGDEYKGLDPDVGYWRDTHLRIAGPAVQSVQAAFVEDWNWASKTIVTGLDWEPHPAPSGESKAVLCLPSGPADPMETCTLFFVNLINLAEQRLWIASPYFVPDEQFITALQLAALRGVDVKVLIPDETDNALVQMSTWSFIDELAEAGVTFHRYTKGFMHHKVVLVDDAYCTVGTANFDNRSFRLNFEITIAVADEEFNGRVADMLEQDFMDARPMNDGEFSERGFWFRLAARAARLTAPVQ